MKKRENKLGKMFGGCFGGATIQLNNERARLSAEALGCEPPSPGWPALRTN